MCLHNVVGKKSKQKAKTKDKVQC